LEGTAEWKAPGARAESADERGSTLSNQQSEQDKKQSVQEIIDQMVKPQGPKEGESKPPAPPPKPAESDQDAGGGYNPDHTNPQT